MTPIRPCHTRCGYLVPRNWGRQILVIIVVLAIGLVIIVILVVVVMDIISIIIVVIIVCTKFVGYNFG